jgi:hypothetical protein
LYSPGLLIHGAIVGAEQDACVGKLGQEGVDGVNGLSGIGRRVGALAQVVTSTQMHANHRRSELGLFEGGNRLLDGSHGLHLAEQ